MQSPTLHIDKHRSAGEHKPRILLSLNNPKDRRLIQNFLPDPHYVDIQTGNDRLDEQAFDLCIVDQQTFPVYKEKLQKLKDRANPVFLPMLLLSENKAQVRSNSVLLEFADDVIYIPASKKLMKSRVKLLLKQREYSLKLEEKNCELEQKNRELAEKKRKFQLLTENSTDMISRHTPDGTYLYVSPASEALTGYTPEELVGRNAFDNIHPDDRERLLEKSVNQFENRSIVRHTFRKGTKDGNYKWVETTMRAIKDDETGEVIEIQASTRDITKRVQYEQELQEEKEFTDTAIESLPELFYVVDENQNFVRWNNRIEEELGYSSEEIEQMHPLEFYREEDHEFISLKIKEAFETGDAEAEVNMKSKSGDLIPYHVNAKRFSRGDKNYIVGSCMNLSEMKEAQYELEQHRQLLDAIINQTETVIYVKDSDRKVRLVNESYLEVFGLEREEVIGKTDLEIHGREIDENVREYDRIVLEEGKTIEVEEEIPLEEETRFYHTIKYPLSGVPGFENCVCGISTDITDLKKASRQLKERIKEQRCLYNISSLPEEVESIDELLEKAVTYLPDGWQYPEITEAAIEFGDETYQTNGYHETDWMLSSRSNRVKDKPLQVNIVYTQEMRTMDEGLFLEEERRLIDSIADILSSQIDRIMAQQQLEESKNRWEQLVKNDPDLIQILIDREIKFINQAGAEMYGVDDPEQIIGKNTEDLIDVENIEEVELREKKLREGQPVEPLIHKVKAMDGKVRYIKTRSTPITYKGNDRAIQVVGQDVTGQVQYEKELKQSLKEKETLLQEIHHRVKNNLAVVSGMMELQMFNTDNEELKSLLGSSKNRIKTMALIHEKLYQSASLSEIDFASYVKDLLKNIREVSTGRDDIELKFDSDSFSLNVNQAVPCALIINEVVSNAYEHAFVDQEEGVVNISLEEKGNTVCITVEDNGRGLPNDFREKQRQTLGFSIIETLITQLGADVNIDGDKGLTFAFSFEKQEVKGSTSSII